MTGVLLMAILVADRVPFRLMKNDVVAIEVSVNREGPFLFMLDTGTSTTLVSLELAQRLSLAPLDRVRLVTPGGARLVARARLESLAVGSAAVVDPFVVCVDFGPLRDAAGPIDGVLGQNFLERFNYTVDYERRLLKFDEAGASPPVGSRVPLECSRGRVLIKANGARLVLDSGADNLVLFESRRRKPALPVERSFDAGRLATSAGTGFVRTGWVPFLTVGGETFRDLPAALVSSASGEERAEDGLLPTRLFRFLYFNHREGYVVLRRSDRLRR